MHLMISANPMYQVSLLRFQWLLFTFIGSNHYFSHGNPGLICQLGHADDTVRFKQLSMAACLRALCSHFWLLVGFVPCLTVCIVLALVTFFIPTTLSFLATSNYIMDVW